MSDIDIELSLRKKIEKQFLSLCNCTHRNASEVFDLALRFDSNVETTEVKILDGDGNVVNQDIVDCPADVNEVVAVSFLSETTPEYLYTPGLQNGEGGFIRISETALTTKGDSNSLLLVIRQ